MNAREASGTAALGQAGVTRPLSEAAAWAALHAEATTRYRSSGRFAWHFARGKLGRDPVFRQMLALGLVAPGTRVLDVGCGQALLANLFAACEALAARGAWPAGWPAAPVGTRYRGLELMPRDVARAQAALHGLPRAPQVLQADMREAVFEPCDLVVILDVLHYVDIAAQDAVLDRVRAALAPRGRLLLRVGDASQSLGFAASQWVDRAVIWVRGHRAAPTWGRALDGWTHALQVRGFSVQPRRMSQGTPFANVLLVCDLGPRSPTPR